MVKDEALTRDLSKFVKLNHFYVMDQNYVVFFDEVTIRRNRLTKIPINKDFYNIVIPETIKVLAAPYNCKVTHYLQYYVEKNYIYIKTNARTEKNTIEDKTILKRWWDYVTLQLVVMGVRWDSYNYTNLFNYFSNTEKILPDSRIQINLK